MKNKKFYITTPIYYASGNLHIGHAYTTVAADAISRYKRKRGYDVLFLTGTDEHGQKVETNAKLDNKTPQDFVDGLVSNIKELWSKLNISYDQFIRTTDEDHKRRVQEIFTKLYESGDIYLGKYKGLYCSHCESFWTESQLVNGKCPDCGREVAVTEEDCYFFKMTKYQDRLIELFENHPEFVQPESRAKEMLNNFLRPGLTDLAVSRKGLKWGIPVPFDPDHVIYVWIDALSNYITALGYPENMGKFEAYWPADIHLVGKEIVRFHTLIWPALLMSLQLPLPKQVYGHGWLLFKGGKMSKSLGNVVDPFILSDRYGVDAVRYFLLREVPFGMDGAYSNDALISRINADLANDLGNLVNRTLVMADKYFAGVLPEEKAAEPIDEDLKEKALSLFASIEKSMDSMQINVALTDIWQFVSRCNKYIDETTPWTLIKDESKHSRLAAVLYNLLEAIRVIAVYIEPFMPETADKIFETLTIANDEKQKDMNSVQVWGSFKPTAQLVPSAPLYPRLDMDTEIEYLNTFVADKKEEKKEEEKPEGVQTIDFEDFSKLELKVGTVKTCQKVEKADKLLQLEVDLGTETRTILSGIAQAYSPEDLVEKQVVIVANLKPRKIRGVLSHGMILCATDNGVYRVVTVDGTVQPGSVVN